MEIIQNLMEFTIVIPIMFLLSFTADKLQEQFNLTSKCTVLIYSLISGLLTAIVIGL